jgi:hypothetical protein
VAPGVVFETLKFKLPLPKHVSSVVVTSNVKLFNWEKDNFPINKMITKKFNLLILFLYEIQKYKI